MSEDGMGRGEGYSDEFNSGDLADYEVGLEESARKTINFLLDEARDNDTDNVDLANDLKVLGPKGSFRYFGFEFDNFDDYRTMFPAIIQGVIDGDYET